MFVCRSQSPIRVQRVVVIGGPDRPGLAFGVAPHAAKLDDSEQPAPLPDPVLGVKDRPAGRRPGSPGQPGQTRGRAQAGQRRRWRHPRFVWPSEPRSAGPSGAAADRAVAAWPSAATRWCEVDDVGQRTEVEPAGIDQDPMHNDVGIDKLSHLGPRVRAGLAGNSHDDVRGPGAGRPARRGDRWAPGPGRDRSGNGGRNAGSGVASSRIGNDRHRQSRRSAARSTGSCPAGESSGERRAGHRQAERGSGVPRRPRSSARYLIMSGVLFMNRHRSLGLYLDDLATAEPSRGSAPTFSILGLTILGSPRTIRFSFKLFDRPNRR